MEWMINAGHPCLSQKMSNFATVAFKGNHQEQGFVYVFLQGSRDISKANLFQIFICMAIKCRNQELKTFQPSLLSPLSGNLVCQWQLFYNFSSPNSNCRLPAVPLPNLDFILWRNCSPSVAEGWPQWIRWKYK